MISIIIPVFNAYKFSSKCIDSIIKNTSLKYEIIVVDNGSTDQTCKEFSNNNRVNYIKNSENLGFSKAVNIGIKNSKGKFCVILNNDTLVSYNWLNKLKKCYENSENPGIISPVSNNAGIYQSVEKNTKDNEYKDISLKIFKEFKYETQISKALSGFCMFFKKSLIDEIGYFDENFEIGNFEDNDICIRCKNAGYNLYIAKGIFIFHYGQKTFLENSINYNKCFNENKLIFEKKWSGYYFADRKELLTLIDNVPKKVLDIGCATGVFGKLLKDKYNCCVTGIEINKRICKIAENNIDKVICCNVETNFPEIKDKFDIIILADILEHLKNPENLLNNIKNLLNSNGYIIISVPNVSHYSVVMNLLWGNWDYTSSGILDKTHLRFFTFNSIKRMLKENGFKIGSFNCIRNHINPELKNIFKYLEKQKIVGPAFTNEAEIFQYLLKVYS